MNKEELIERLQGESHITMTGMKVPVDSISIEALAGVLLEMMPEYKGEKELKPGVRVLSNGRLMLDGKFITKEEGYL